MAGVNPTSGIGSSPFVTGAARQAANQQAKPASKPGFDEALKGAVENVNDQQNESVSAVQELLTGRNQDVLGVVSSVAEADMSFKLLMGVRNKVVEAYKQMMNMQV